MPIQVWRFGDELSMVFLGGEVVVDYALRAKQELDADNVWVTAYANDVFAYVASERMRAEGGYEVDRSMEYYGRAGRWDSGTEDIILRRIHDLHDSDTPQSPLPIEDALRSFHLPDGYTIDVVAAEPLIRDPVNFAVGSDGRLWVVEMSDYPRGANDDGSPGGRIRVLSDTDGDGRYETGSTFLDNLPYPNGVYPWRDGALISAAPDLMFARDLDGDGVADSTEVWWNGFDEGNPQHRFTGFSHGLDNWLYLAASESQKQATNVATGEVFNFSGRDLRFNPRTREMRPISGLSQYGRCRTDWGDWFGNSNSKPLYLYAIEDRYLARNPFVPAPSSQIAMTQPARAPRVYPRSRTEGRFNDLFAANRFTSACSPHVFRASMLGDGMKGAALICEPVHNLVSRRVLHESGAILTAERHRDDSESEFLASTDNWSRPVFVQTGPDGSLWVADMYRQVIEHPKWIPQSWQAKLDLYAGTNYGRIYRIYRRNEPLSSIPDFTRMTTDEVVSSLASDNGWKRDIAQQTLLELNDPQSFDSLRDQLRNASLSKTRLHAMWALHGLAQLSVADLAVALRDDEPRLVAQAIAASESLDDARVHSLIAALATHKSPRVRFAVALAAGNWTDDKLRSRALKNVLERDTDEWIRTAVISSAVGVADQLLAARLQESRYSVRDPRLTSQLIATALASDVDGGVGRILELLIPDQDSTSELDEWQVAAVADLADGLRQRNTTLREFVTRSSPETGNQLDRITELIRKWIDRILSGPEAAIMSQKTALRMLGRLAMNAATRKRKLEPFLTSRAAPELQSAAVESAAVARTPELLIQAYPSLGLAARSEVLAYLLTRSAWVNLLLDAVEAETIRAGDLDATTQNRLRVYGSKLVRLRAQKLLALPEKRRDVIRRYASAADSAGVSDRGKRLFRERCASCHKHNGVGNDLGPRLSGLRNRSTGFLLESILDPNRAVEAKYLGYVVTTEDGRTFAGMMAEESATALKLVQADGNTIVLLRNTIEEVMSTGQSFMPEGLEKGLNPQQLADIIAHVQSSGD